MFSFIKWFGAWIERLQKNKGVWFTTLTTISLLGIFLSLTFVNYLVSDVAKKTYENQKTQFELRLKNELSTHKERTLAIATTASKNEQMKELFISDDENATQKIKESIASIQTAIAQAMGSQDFRVKLEQSENFVEPKIYNGVEVTKEGAFFFADVPYVKTEKFIAKIVALEEMASLGKIFKTEEREFLFLLNDASINKVDANLRKSNYTKLFEKYYLKNDAYDRTFEENFKSIDFEALKKEGYFKDKNYFYIAQEVFDYEGELVGLGVMAENMSQDNSFVNLVKNLVNSVTMVALGLIVSMILFLF